jgi:hypothetical protein
LGHLFSTSAQLNRRQKVIFLPPASPRVGHPGGSEDLILFQLCGGREDQTEEFYAEFAEDTEGAEKKKNQNKRPRQKSGPLDACADLN